MTKVKKIEAAVGEDDAAPVAFLAAKPQNRFVQSENSRVQRVSMQAKRRTAMTLPETVVYHAREWRCLRGGRTR